MPIRQLQLHCTPCNAVMPHNQPTPNHVLHAIVSVFVLGLWVPIWIIIALTSGNEPATCVKCGTKQAPTRAEIEAQQPDVEAIGWDRTVWLAVIGGVALGAFFFVAGWQRWL